MAVQDASGRSNSGVPAAKPSTGSVKPMTASAPPPWTTPVIRRRRVTVSPSKAPGAGVHELALADRLDGQREGVVLTTRGPSDGVVGVRGGGAGGAGEQRVGLQEVRLQRGEGAHAISAKAAAAASSVRVTCSD